MDRPDGRRVRKFDGPLGRGLWYRPLGDEYYNAAFRRSRPHRVSYSFLLSYTLSRCAGLPLKGKQGLAAELAMCCLSPAKHSAEFATSGGIYRVEIIHPSHTTVRTVRYTAVRFFGQEYIPACHFFRFLKIILSPPFRIFASSAIFRQEVSPITAFCFNV